MTIYRWLQDASSHDPSAMRKILKENRELKAQNKVLCALVKKFSIEAGNKKNGFIVDATEDETSKDGLRRQLCQSLDISPCSCTKGLTLKRLDQRNAADVERLREVNQLWPLYGVRRLADKLNWSEGKTWRIRDLAGVRVRRAAQSLTSPNRLLKRLLKPLTIFS